MSITVAQLLKMSYKKQKKFKQSSYKEIHRTNVGMTLQRKKTRLVKSRKV